LTIIKDPHSFFELTKSLSGAIGFVPTMGALHEGHISLISKARKENKHCIVSIFVNPTQFLAGEDLSKYPRRETADIKLCELAGVDVLFMPSSDDMYGFDEPRIITGDISGYIFEGEKRPGHFDGMLTIVMKLLNISSATRAYFGQKDTQQLLLIKKMCSAFFIPVEIMECPTIREKDGLALSSRNVYLSAEERKEALKISKSLFVCGALIGKGQLDCGFLYDAMRAELQSVSIEYIAFCNRELNKIDKITLGESVILIACKIGATRLIDNLWV
jgi:pantoate--beta-alanine ligase